MPPAQTRKRRSGDMATPEAVTPTHSPAAKRMKVTQSQKQALIDNLQLEVTDRARRLRAQYALQCADLKARIERRINRIPISMRKMTMAELAAAHETTEKKDQHTAAPMPVTTKPPVKSMERPLPNVPQPSSKSASPARGIKTVPLPKGRKRKSSEIHIASDKENDVEPSNPITEALPVQKNAKRAKTANNVAATSNSSHNNNATSRSKAQAGGVLSPRSHNSRTLPRSPIKDMAPPASPTKSHIARPISPLKSNSPLKSAATAATTAISASVHGMLESARQRAHNVGTKPGRVNSREKAPITKKAASTRAAATGTRAASAMSNVSTITDTSNASADTVVTKPAKRGAAAQPHTAAAAAATTKTATTKEKKTGSVARSAAGKAATALKKSATTAAAKKAAAAAPAVTTATPTEATGKRVLRKRN